MTPRKRGGSDGVSLGIDANGYPILFTAEGQKTPSKPLKRSEKPKPERQPMPLLDRREVLTAPQAAQVLGMPVEKAVATMMNESLPRIAGWDRHSVVRLRRRLDGESTEGP